MPMIIELILKHAGGKKFPPVYILEVYMRRKVYKVLAVLAAISLIVPTAGCKKKAKEIPPESESESIVATATTSPSPSPSVSEVESESEETSESTLKEANGKTPYELHGKLSISGTNIVDENGDIFQPCGVSTHGLGWFPEYVNQDAVYSLRDDFGANILRLALYTAEGAGYCTGGDKASLKQTVINGVDYATNAGMYVIIDWHILHDLDPNVYKTEAIAFFDEMSKKYADNGNVIYEICNEPNGGTSWSSIKSYANEVIPVIRANDPDSIIVVGTPNWSQFVDEAAADPITGYDNIAYAVHFYADTHKQDLRDRVSKATKAGLPVLITEFSICDASGNGNNNIAEANTWIQFLDSNHIGFIAWNLSNKAESSSLISSGVQKKSGWNYDELSESGKWLVAVLNTHSDQGSSLIKDGGASTVTPSTQASGGNAGNASSGATPEISIAPSAVGSSADLKVTVSATNSWKEGSSTCTQYQVSITNTGSGKVSNWAVDIDFGTAPELNQIWCAKSAISGNVMTITPESFNSTLSGNATTSDIGFIIKTANVPGTPAITVR